MLLGVWDSRKDLEELLVRRLLDLEPSRESPEKVPGTRFGCGPQSVRNLTEAGDPGLGGPGGDPVNGQRP